MANSSTNNAAPGHIEGLDLLREAIVLQAVSDLRGVLAGRKMPLTCSATELRNFFAVNGRRSCSARLTGRRFTAES